jgi:hypothetical protein
VIRRRRISWPPFEDVAAFTGVALFLLLVVGGAVVPRDWYGELLGIAVLPSAMAVGMACAFLKQRQKR